MLIDIRTFRLAEGVSDERFLAADEEAQAIAHRSYGIVRRTTARREADGRWLVLTFWWNAEVADAAPDDGLSALIADEHVERFEDIGG